MKLYLINGHWHMGCYVNGRLYIVGWCGRQGGNIVAHTRFRAGAVCPTCGR